MSMFSGERYVLIRLSVAPCKEKTLGCSQHIKHGSVLRMQWTHDTVFCSKSLMISALRGGYGDSELEFSSSHFKSSVACALSSFRWAQTRRRIGRPRLKSCFGKAVAAPATALLSLLLAASDTPSPIGRATYRLREPQAESSESAATGNLSVAESMAHRGHWRQRSLG